MNIAELVVDGFDGHTVGSHSRCGLQLGRMPPAWKPWNDSCAVDRCSNLEPEVQSCWAFFLIGWARTRTKGGAYVEAYVVVGTVDGNEPAGATAHGASVLLGGAHDSLTIVVAVCQTQEGRRTVLGCCAPVCVLLRRVVALRFES